jgi:hypothetical protein
MLGRLEARARLRIDDPIEVVLARERFRFVEAGPVLRSSLPNGAGPLPTRPSALPRSLPELCREPFGRGDHPNVALRRVELAVAGREQRG